MKLISDDPAFRAPGTEAAGNAGRRPGGPDPHADPGIQEDLEYLEYHWGSAYLPGWQDGQLTAVRRDGRGGILADPDRDGLIRKIAADYTADPVPRDLPVNGPRRDCWPPAPAGMCLTCHTPDPTAEMTCLMGADHRVGTASGCPSCGRLKAACAARPCPAAIAAGPEGTP